VTSKTQRSHKVAKQHKASNRSVGNQKTNCVQTKSNKIWFRKTRSEKRGKEANLAEEDQNDDVMEKYRKKAPLMIHARITTKKPIKVPYKAISEANQKMIN